MQITVRDAQWSGRDVDVRGAEIEVRVGEHIQRERNLKEWMSPEMRSWVDMCRDRLERDIRMIQCPYFAGMRNGDDVLERRRCGDIGSDRKSIDERTDTRFQLRISSDGDRPHADNNTNRKSGLG